MCGIIAVKAAHEPVAERDVVRAMDAIAHRGPDGRNHWIGHGGRVALGHVRLSIIDLEGGVQPIANEDESIRVVVNGELYGHDEARRELEAKGHRFRTKSDSEIALHAYEEYGASFLSRLRGEFAFVLWDDRNKTLLAARDRFGIKPLYYAFHHGSLLVASEAKALFAAGVPARWDRESVFHYTNSLSSSGVDRTLFEGVFQVPPGHYLLASDGHFQVVPYWDFDFTAGSTDSPPRSEAEAIEQFRALLEESVRLRLRADVPVGCYLSGGLDSCAVLGFAARHSATPVTAFTIAFDDPRYDESSIARAAAERAGANFVPVPVSHADIADAFADAVAQQEMVALNAHGVAKFLLSKAVREAGFKVVLTGEGADEVLAGYPHYRRDLLAYGDHGFSPDEVRAQMEWLQATNTISKGMLMPDGAASPALDAVKRSLGVIPSFMETANAGGQKASALLHPEFLAGYKGRQTERLFLQSLPTERMRSWHPVHKSMYLWAKCGLPNYILTVLGDRMEMAHSVEGRVPFLDHKLVELASKLPVSLLIKGMTEKYVLREAARDVLTDVVYKRQKHPFAAPPSTLSPDGPLFAMLRDTLLGKSCAALPFYNHRAIAGLLDTIPRMDAPMRAALEPALLPIACLAILGERYGITEGAGR